MDINELLQEEIEKLDDIEKDIVEYIFKELDNNQYLNMSTLEEKTLEKIDERLGV